MPDLRFLNVRFNRDAELERAIYDALTAYPAGVRSQVIRDALAVHLGIESGASGNGARPRSRALKPVQQRLSRQSTEVQNPYNGKKAQEAVQEKLPEHTPEIADSSGKKQSEEEQNAVKGLLSLLH